MNTKFNLKGFFCEDDKLFHVVWILFYLVFAIEDSSIFLVYCHDITALQLTFNCVMSQTNKFRKHIDIKPNLALSYGEYLINAL